RRTVGLAIIMATLSACTWPRRVPRSLFSERARAVGSLGAKNLGELFKSGACLACWRCVVIVGKDAGAREPAAWLRHHRTAATLPFAPCLATSAPVPRHTGAGGCPNRRAGRHGPSVHLSHAGSLQDLSGQSENLGERQSVVLSRRQDRGARG